MPYSTEDLLYLMDRLREPGSGCPWDLKQTYATIAPSTIEEAYEVVDTIERGDYDHLHEELGDLLFQVVFYSQLASEEKRFDFLSVIDGLVTKLVRRHPHVFPDGTLQSRVEDQSMVSEDVKVRWEEIKQQERSDKGAGGVLDDVPLNLPALPRAGKLQKRASGVGFDWPDVSGPVAKIHEELAEFEQTLESGDKAAQTEELGDLLFAVANAARHLKIDPEAALRSANRKFEQRFEYVEARVKGQFQNYALDELEGYWQEAKGKTVVK